MPTARTIEFDSKTIADALSSLQKLRTVIAGDIGLGDWSTSGTFGDWSTSGTRRDAWERNSNQGVIGFIAVEGSRAKALNFLETMMATDWNGDSHPSVPPGKTWSRIRVLHYHYNILKTFQTVAMALKQMRPQHPSLGVTLTVSLEEQHDLRRRSPRRNLWYEDGKSVKHLLLKLYQNEQGFDRIHVAELASDSVPVESLEVRYSYKLPLPMAPQSGPEPIDLRRLRFPHLRRLELRNLWSTASEFVALFQGYRDQLEHISLIECSVKCNPASDTSVAPSIDTAGSWAPVIRVLADMPHLSTLKFEKLDSNGKGEGDVDDEQVSATNIDMAVRTSWRTRSEVSAGLHRLMQNDD